jgi:16S rRNA (cytidine1402-2'-O)-methyltransferase
MATLYVVATPIGHLGDLSARAIEVLRTVPVVAAEDTRRSRGLLEHIGAHPQLRSFHAHSPERRLEMLVEILSDGRDVALVSDAGTPGVSDPGADLVQAALQAGHVVVPIPGPSAIATVLSASGLSADRFLFLGFVPRKGADRTRLLARAATEEFTVLFYEAPNRVLELLEDLLALAGPMRRVTIGRELTKLHEEIGTDHSRAGAAFQRHGTRGEFTVVLEGTGLPPVKADRTEEAPPVPASC